MKRITFVFSLLLIVLLSACRQDAEFAPSADNYFHVKVENAYLPVWVRGNTASNKILLYIAGGPGGSSIDLAKIDYASWQETLETDYAIAYYDQRGVGNNQGTFDLSTVNMDQYAADLRRVIQLLHQQYDQAEIYLFGHSFGGYLSYHYLATYASETLVDGCIAFNGPATIDADEERWVFRREYLKNVAVELLAAGQDTAHWQEALAWVEATPVIATQEEQRKWNELVWPSVIETERPITIGDVLDVLFFSPYNYFSVYANGKLDNVVDVLFDDIKSVDMLARLPLVEERILLITGRFDDIAPPEEMEVVLDMLGSEEKELVIIPDAGHDPSMDQPELFVQAVEGFVK